MWKLIELYEENPFGWIRLRRKWKLSSFFNPVLPMSTICFCFCLVLRHLGKIEPTSSNKVDIRWNKLKCTRRSKTFSTQQALHLWFNSTLRFFCQNSLPTCWLFFQIYYFCTTAKEIGVLYQKGIVKLVNHGVSPDKITIIRSVLR